MEQYMWAIWLAIFAITLIIEVSVSGMVSIWLSISALITLALSFIPKLYYWGEIIIFVVLSLVLLGATRPFVKKFLSKKKETRTNLDLLIGKKFKLIKDVEKFSKGEIKVNGVIWDCESENNQIINKDKEVEVIKISGNKLIVREVSENV